MNSARAPLSQRLRDEDFDNFDAIVTVDDDGRSLQNYHCKPIFEKVNGQNKDAVISNLINNQQEKVEEEGFLRSRSCSDEITLSSNENPQDEDNVDKDNGNDCNDRDDCKDGLYSIRASHANHVNRNQCSCCGTHKSL